jgi:flavodoxin/Pyruvate/2-oxoacid:ferredoxin oxidoreductase delta subunit
MRISLIYFSPTGNTAQISEIIKNKLVELGEEVFEHDITSYSSRQNKIDFRNYDFAFFGFPIYAHRIPEIMREWIESLEGYGLPCSLFFTYGGVTMGVGHYDTKKRLEKQNFKLITSAEFCARHTFNLAGWKVLEKRPDERDFAVAKEYVLKTLDKVKKPETWGIIFEEPKITDKQLERLDKVPKKGVVPPFRMKKECSMCLNCEKDCPSNAMNAEVGRADGEKCIRCLRCVAICPDKILQVNDMIPAYDIIVKPSNPNPKVLESKASRYFI